MNLPAYFRGSLKALGRGEDWPPYFDLSRKGFKQSFIALALTMPCYYVCGLAVTAERIKQTDNLDSASIPVLAFVIIFALYALTFVCTAYILSMVFDKQDRFRPWVIVRHWAVFFAVLIVAATFGLYMLGLVPFMIANLIAFVIYLGTLAIDIRLAQKIAGYEWGAAVLAACIIYSMGLAVILTGVAQFVR